MDLAEKIAKILIEQDYCTASNNLRTMSELQQIGMNDLLYNIIFERWINKPDDIPFSIANMIWNRFDMDVGKAREMLDKVLIYPIAAINRAKINDFLWIEEKEFSRAKNAVRAYYEHLNNTTRFDNSFIAVNRLVFISKKINSRDINADVRKCMLTKVLEQYNNTNHSRVCFLLKTAKEENVDTSYLISYVEKILATYEDTSCDFTIIGEFCDLLESFYLAKNTWQKKKCVTEPKLIEIRRRKINAIKMAAGCQETSGSVSLMRKIKYLKDCVNLLKTISGTEAERKKLLQEIDILEKESLSQMPVFKNKYDVTELVNTLINYLKVLDKEEALCYFAIFIPLPQKERVEKKTLEDRGILNVIFPTAILGHDGKLIAKNRNIWNDKEEIDEQAKNNKLEHRVGMEMDFVAQTIVGNAFEYIRTNYVIEEKDIRDIVAKSVIVPNDRKESYSKGLLAGFTGDFITALSILVPQIENAVRCLAIECGEPVYNINEEGMEEIKTMHAVLELEGIKDCLDEDLLLALKTIFCSKFGFNIRNNIAHGIFSDNFFQSFKALYVWWFALKFCYLFTGKLQSENRDKVNNKLNKLLETTNRVSE